MNKLLHGWNLMIFRISKPKPWDSGVLWLAVGFEEQQTHLSSFASCRCPLWLRTVQLAGDKAGFQRFPWNLCPQPLVAAQGMAAAFLSILLVQWCGNALPLLFSHPREAPTPADTETASPTRQLVGATRGVGIFSQETRRNLPPPAPTSLTGQGRAMLSQSVHRITETQNGLC